MIKLLFGYWLMDTRAMLLPPAPHQGFRVERHTFKAVCFLGSWVLARRTGSLGYTGGV